MNHWLPLFVLLLMTVLSFPVVLAGEEASGSPLQLAQADTTDQEHEHEHDRNHEEIPADEHTAHEHDDHDADHDHHEHMHGDMPDLIHWLGHFHPLVVHFPVGLLIVAAIGELIGLASRRRWFFDAARFCVWAGAIGAVIAAPLGWFNSGWVLDHDDLLMATHRWLGTLVFFWSIALVVLVELTYRRPATRWRYSYWITLFAGALLVAITAHFGGAIVFGPDYYHWPS